MIWIRDILRDPEQASLLPARFCIPRWNLPHSLFSAFPEVSFTAPRQKHSSSARDASRTCDLSLLLWIVFRLSETPHKVILCIYWYQSAFINDLHLPPITYHLLKIDDYSVPKCSKWKQPRKVGQVSLFIQQVYLEHLLRCHPKHWGYISEQERWDPCFMELPFQLET